MRLTVLGGSAAGGNPGQGCSGYLVQSGGTRIALDLGPGTLPVLRLHADARELDGIVVSHLHLDHVLDLLALRYSLAYGPHPPARRVPLFLPPGGLAFLDRLATALADDGEGGPYFDVFAVTEYDPGAGLTIGDFAIAFAPTVHYVPCWAMRVSGLHAADLVYTADTGPSADLAPFARDAGVIVVEGSADTPGDEPWESRGHMTPEEAGALAASADARALVLTHLWVEHGVELSVRRAATTFSGRIEIARPGLTIEW